MFVTHQIKEKTRHGLIERSNNNNSRRTEVPKIHTCISSVWHPVPISSSTRPIQRGSTCLAISSPSWILFFWLSLTWPKFVGNKFEMWVQKWTFSDIFHVIPCRDWLLQQLNLNTDSVFTTKLVITALNTLQVSSASLKLSLNPRPRDLSNFLAHKYNFFALGLGDPWTFLLQVENPPPFRSIAWQIFSLNQV
jgi:hypothetical protein